MKLIADLHIHSYLSRATSKQLNLEHLHKWAQLKGIQVVGTGDITHPQWLTELTEKLEPAEEGLFRLKPEFVKITASEVPESCKGPVRFLLATEISNIYKKNGQVRKVHNVVFMPHLEAAEKFHRTLDRIGNVRSDGRPILGLDSKDLLEIVLETDDQAYLVPAHIWTPWFSVLGSKSGFDTIEECYDELTSHIFAVETGLSSDPSMNWRLSQLDKFALISNSDAHSPAKLGREANLFDTELSYPAIFGALKNRDPEQFLGTIEFYPEEGKYHLDGHRKCRARMSPADTIEHNERCPVCGKKVTVGVMHRVEVLADREPGARPDGAAPFTSLIPLPEIISEVQGVGVNSKCVQSIYQKMLSRFGAEFDILQHTPLDDLDKLGNPMLTEGIRRFRAGEVQIAAGYDGEFGVIKLFLPEERDKMLSQLVFFEHDVPKPKIPKKPAPRPSVKKKDKSQIADTHSPRWVTRDAFDAIPEENVLMGLNVPQSDAAQTISGPLLIVAGPGTGKTRTLTHRIAYLIYKKNIQPEQVLAVTFTNHAAREMTERLALLLPDGQTEALCVKTFHALGGQILRQVAELLTLTPDFSIHDESDKLEVLRNLRPDLPRKTLKAAADFISSAKNQLLSPDKCRTTESFSDQPELIQIYDKYEAVQRSYNAVDYDDLIFKCCECFETYPQIRRKFQDKFRWISVDEYQDINYAQYRFLRLLMSPETNLCAIGDPDQAIYGFRGSDQSYFMRFQQDFPGAKIIHLDQNYRSTTTILEASTQVISENPNRQSEKTWSEIFGTTRIEIGHAPTDKAEAEYVVHQIERMVGGTGFFSVDSGRLGSDESDCGEFGFSDVAVLYRLTAQCAALEEAFLRSGMPYQTMAETPFFERKPIKQVISYLRMLQNHAADLDVLRILNVPPRGIGEKSIRIISDYCRDKSISIYEGIECAALIPGLSDSARNALVKFYTLIQELSFDAQKQPVDDLLTIILNETGLRAFHGDGEKAQAGWATLSRYAKTYGDRLDKFLEDAALQKETDEYDSRAERVSLMSLHASKGLEFPVVFIVGCEENLLPYHRTDEPLAVSVIEEERRLLYVGMTRAQQRLILLHAKQRLLFGQFMKNQPSRFLNDIERSLKHMHETLEVRKLKPAKPEDHQLGLFSS